MVVVMVSELMPDCTWSVLAAEPLVLAVTACPREQAVRGTGGKGCECF